LAAGRACVTDFVATRGHYVLDIYIDADGCPVKQEVYGVAMRYGLKVTVVANSRMRMPLEGPIELVVVEGKFDAADDWIVGHVRENDIVVSADIPLAARCLDKGALVLGPSGRVFTKDSIGEALATREILSHLRELGTITRGPAPVDTRARSRFLQRLDQMIQAVRTGK